MSSVPKESLKEDGGIKSEKGAKRERGALTIGVQKGKRLPRPPRNNPLRGSRNNEGSQAAVDVVPYDDYDSAEHVQEMVKLWTEHEEAHADKALESSGPTVEIRIPAKHVNYSNRQVQGMKLWGTDVYTVDSDIAAGYYRPITFPPPPAAQELRATVRVLPPQAGYISTLRNNVRSRAWGATAACSFRVEQCCILKKGGGILEIKPCQSHVTTIAMEPTFAPAAAESIVTTKAAAKNASCDQRLIGDVRLMFNLCNEPWPKYSINAVADRGDTAPLFTSARLKQGEVLYLETCFSRYELCFSGEKVLGERMDTDGENSVVNVFRWSRLKRPIPHKLMPIYGIPLPPGKVEIIADGLEWEDIKWSQTGVLIAGKEYRLFRSMFLSA